MISNNTVYLLDGSKPAKFPPLTINELDDRQGKGKIVIEYYSKDERERLLEFLTEKKS